MGATIDGIALFYAMTKNPAPAMVAGWRDGLNCTFKTVKNVRPAGYCYLKSFIVIIPASLAFSHTHILLIVSVATEVVDVQQSGWEPPVGSARPAICASFSARRRGVASHESQSPITSLPFPLRPFGLSPRIGT
jgi:hypothetical protein